MARGRDTHARREGGVMFGKLRKLFSCRHRKGEQKTYLQGGDDGLLIVHFVCAKCGETVPNGAFIATFDGLDRLAKRGREMRHGAVERVV